MSQTYNASFFKPTGGDSSRQITQNQNYFQNDQPQYNKTFAPGLQVQRFASEDSPERTGESIKERKTPPLYLKKTINGASVLGNMSDMTGGLSGKSTVQKTLKPAHVLSSKDIIIVERNQIDSNLTSPTPNQQDRTTIPLSQGGFFHRN